MSNEEFIARFAEAVGENASSLTLETELGKIEGWDSVAYLSVTVLIDEGMGVMVSPEALVEAVTVGDILSAARAAKG